MLLRHRYWLALATTLVALASCELNPQPILPADRAASDPMISGGTKSGGNGSPEPEMPGNASGEGGTTGVTGPGAGGAPTDGGGGEGATGGESTGAAGAAGESAGGAAP